MSAAPTNAGEADRERHRRNAQAVAASFPRALEKVLIRLPHLAPP